MAFRDPPQDWPPEDIARLRELWATGMSTAKIGQAMGRTKSAVVGKAHRLDLPGRKSPIKKAAAPAPKPATRPAAAAPKIQPEKAPLQRIPLLRGGAAAFQHIMARNAQARAADQAPTPEPQRELREAPPPAVSAAVRESGRACRYCLPSGQDFPRWRYCDAPIQADGRRYPYCDEHYYRCIQQRAEKQDAA
jgi:GcrA cell cycle regulator